MNEHLIKETTSSVLNIKEDQVEIKHRLMGGMSNFTYVIKADEETYTFRIPGKNAEQFVNRTVEKANIERIKPLGLNNETVYLDIDSGIKIAKYMEGVPLSEKNPLDYLEDAAKLLKSIHTSLIKSDYPYAPFDRLETYERYLDAYDYTHDERYLKAKAKLHSHRAFLEENELTLSHGDSQISNFLVTEEGLKLMDWEFTGMNDPYYDLACFGNNDFSHAEALLPDYLERTPSIPEWNRLYLWRLFQTLQWHNVALYKHFIGLSEDLKIDFYKVSKLYLDKAEAMIKSLR
jgi:thiamine kinase-like enzyme